MGQLVIAPEIAALVMLTFTIALGYSLGRVTVRGVCLGPAGGTICVGLLLGHLGAHSTSVLGIPSPGMLGFALFIYSVGFDAAPHFFASFRERRGWRFLLIGALVNVLAAGVTVAAALAIDLDASTAAGVLAGALTSTPTYAAASEVAPDPARLSVAFALTYPVGLLGLVLLVQVVPRLTRQDLSRGAASDAELQARRARQRTRSPQGSPELERAFEVAEKGVAGRSLRDLDVSGTTGCVISRVHRADDVIVPCGDTVLQEGDRLIVTGRIDELRAFERRIGPERFDEELRAPRVPPRRVEVRNRAVVGRTLGELDLTGRFRCVVTRIERGSLWIEPDGDATLVVGDVLEVVGQRDDVRRAATWLGQFEAPAGETDVAVYAAGIALGLLLGSFSIDAFGVDVGLGAAGGLLVVGLLLGSRQKVGPLRTQVPPEARQLVRELGVLLFVGETALDAGSGLLEALRLLAWQALLVAALVNAVTVLGAVAFARRLLRLRPVDAWGSVCGGLTSSAALHALRRAADSNEAAISYAAAYAVASVLATLAGRALVLLL